MALKQSKTAISSFWATLSPLSKGCTVILPILAAVGILAPYAASTIGTPPFASKTIETRVVQVEQRIDLAERIAIQREIIKLDEEARRRVLSQSEKNYLQDLRARLLELEKRK